MQSQGWGRVQQKPRMSQSCGHVAKTQFVVNLIHPKTLFCVSPQFVALLSIGLFPRNFGRCVHNTITFWHGTTAALLLRYIFLPW